MSLVVLICAANAHAQLNLFPQAFVDDQARCFAVTDEISTSQQEVINQLMGSAVHRQYHFLWHATRGGWDQLSAQEQTALRRNSSAWGGHARLCPMPGTIGQAYNPAGEEFLLMHHMMIDQLQTTLTARGLPCIAGWSRIPADNDPRWPR